MTVRVRQPSEPLTQLDARAASRARLARFHLLFELRSNLGETRATLREVWRCLRGDTHDLGARQRPPLHDELTEFERLLDNSLAERRIELDFADPFGEPLHELEYKPPTLPPLKPARDPVETSFIAVNLLDQDGKPLVGRPWIIELPDGSQHRGVTDDLGWARVRGFTKDGTAKVTFPDFDELDHKTRNAANRVVIPVEGNQPLPDEAEPAPEPAPQPLSLDEGTRFIEFTLVNPKGNPLPGARYSLTFESGRVVEGQVDAKGFARIEGIAGDSAKFRLSKVRAA